ncbi:MAG: QueT transporter family protein [Candidatus Bathyarchaeota archaeon]|nr:QueT transporter family protein [Candidatus Bathyarchaeota archaeon]
MLDLVFMWKSPKMIALTVLTAGLYVILLYPLQGLTFFGGYADFGRVGVGFPIAFSFLFGPAAAWGTAIGNVIRDIAESHLDPSSFFGFIGNFLLGYIPYKLWRATKTEKPKFLSIRNFALVASCAVSACILCGLVIGWGLFWLDYTPFMPTALIIGVTNAVWAVLVGYAVLALLYNFISEHKLLYTDLLNITSIPPKWNKSKTLAIAIFVISAIACFIIGGLFIIEPFALLLLVITCMVALAAVCK